MTVAVVVVAAVVGAAVQVGCVCRHCRSLAVCGMMRRMVL
jgi:hypothetical protein